MRFLRPSRDGVATAASLIKEGGVLVYPTDTVYGIGCDPLNEYAVSRVFEIKGREKVPVPVLGDSIESLERAAVFDELAYELCSMLWPGAVTVVLPKRLPLERVTLGMPDVAVRVPALQLTIELIKQSGGLLVGTSANKSGMPPACSIPELDREVAELVDAVLDGGRSKHCKPSTVISLSGKRLKIVRDGAVSIQELRSILERAGLDIEIA